MNRLRVIRRGKRLNLEDVAKQIGVSPTLVWRWENEVAAPRANHLSALAKVLDVSVQEIVDMFTGASEQVG